MQRVNFVLCEPPRLAPLAPGRAGASAISPSHLFPCREGPQGNAPDADQTASTAQPATPSAGGVAFVSADTSSFLPRATGTYS